MNIIDLSISKMIAGNQAVRKQIIDSCGKILHILIASGDNSLAMSGKRYSSRLGHELEISARSENTINGFIEGGKGIVLLRHQSSIFTDYLPVFSRLGDQVLENADIFTSWYNLEMNRELFPGYSFINGTPLLSPPEGRKTPPIFDEKGKRRIPFDIGEKPFKIIIYHSDEQLNGLKRFATQELPILDLEIRHDTRQAYSDVLGALLYIKNLGKSTLTTKMKQ